MGAGRRSIHLVHCTWLKCSKMFIAVHFPWLPICYVSMFMVSSKLIDHGRGFCSRAVLPMPSVDGTATEEIEPSGAWHTRTAG